MSSSAPLGGLPGAQTDAGTGSVVAALVEGLLADAAALPPADVEIGQALSEHRAHRSAWYGDVVGPLLVPGPAAPALAAALTDGDLGLRVVVVADGHPGNPLAELRDARAALTDSRAELVGVHLPLPAGDDPAQAARAALVALDLTQPAWLVIPNRPGWQGALDVLAADGAECAAARLDGQAGFGSDEALAGFLRLAIDRDLTFALAAADLPVVRTDDQSGVARHGLLNILCTVRAALNGADLEELTPILAECDHAPLCSALRRMSDADAAVARAFLAAVSARVGSTVDELHGLGLIEPPAA
jgi:hypothetical protein